MDINPGDRMEECHGDLEPVGIEISNKKGYVIIHKCKKCGAIRKNKAAEDDNMDLIIELSAHKSWVKIRIKALGNNYLRFFLFTNITEILQKSYKNFTFIIF